VLARAIATAAVAVSIAVPGSQARAQNRVRTLLTGSPTLTIGSGDDASAALTGVSDARRMPNGQLVVANCGAFQIRIFDSAGKHLKTVGQRGAGPGDYQYPRRLIPGGDDTTVVFDALPNFRAVLLGPDGKVLRIFNVPNRLDLLGRLANGAFVARAIEPPRRGEGLQRRLMRLYLLSPEGQISDSLVTDYGTEYIATRVGPFEVPRLGRSAVVTVTRDAIYLGGQDKAEIATLDQSLRPLGSIGTMTSPDPITAAVRKAWDDSRKDLTPDGGVLPVYGEAFAPAQPAYRDIVPGPDGILWVQDPVRPGAYPLIWTAYRKGVPEARVKLPPRFAPTQFGAEWVIGVSFDEAGVETVKQLPLRPGSFDTKTFPPRIAQPPDVVRCGVWAAR
jgi:hypothetical protein